MFNSRQLCNERKEYEIISLKKNIKRVSLYKFYLQMMNKRHQMESHIKNEEGHCSPENVEHWSSKDIDLNQIRPTTYTSLPVHVKCKNLKL